MNLQKKKIYIYLNDDKVDWMITNKGEWSHPFIEIP